MKKKELIFIGGGGFAHEILEVANQLGYSVTGYFDDKETDIGLNYLGTLEKYYLSAGNYEAVFLAIGSTNRKTNNLRQDIISRLESTNVKLPSLVSPQAVISAGVSLGRGIFVAHGVVLSVHTLIGDFCIINTTAVIGHHSIVGSNVTVSPMVFIGGRVKIGNNVVLGATSKILQGLELGESCIVGMGSTVLKSLKDKTTVWPLLNKLSKS